ncbi:MAG: hypothetical protein H6621_06490 [Halobacteriovoraceae bacterium]|nr:hypothetical protein [Halobacteriovoraceae bacterium]
MLKNLIALFVLILSLHSCKEKSGYTSLTRNPSGNKNPIQTCDELKVQYAITASEFSGEECASVENFECDVKVYSPEVKNGKEVVEECLDEGCVTTTHYLFDTSNAVQASDVKPEDFEEGGAYNNTDYSCYNKKIRSKNGQYLITGRAENLKSALSLAREKCY